MKPMSSDIDDREHRTAVQEEGTSKGSHTACRSSLLLGAFPKVGRGRKHTEPSMLSEHRRQRLGSQRPVQLDLAGRDAAGGGSRGRGTHRDLPRGSLESLATKSL